MKTPHCSICGKAGFRKETYSTHKTTNKRVTVLETAQNVFKWIIASVLIFAIIGISGMIGFTLIDLIGWPFWLPTLAFLSLMLGMLYADCLFETMSE